MTGIGKMSNRFHIRINHTGIVLFVLQRCHRKISLRISIRINVNLNGHFFIKPTFKKMRIIRIRQIYIKSLHRFIGPIENLLHDQRAIPNVAFHADHFGGGSCINLNGIVQMGTVDRNGDGDFLVRWHVKRSSPCKFFYLFTYFPFKNCFFESFNN